MTTPSTAPAAAPGIEHQTTGSHHLTVVQSPEIQSSQLFQPDNTADVFMFIGGLMDKPTAEAFSLSAQRMLFPLGFARHGKKGARISDVKNMLKKQIQETYLYKLEKLNIDAAREISTWAGITFVESRLAWAEEEKTRLKMPPTLDIASACSSRMFTGEVFLPGYEPTRDENAYCRIRSCPYNTRFKCKSLDKG